MMKKRKKGNSGDSGAVDDGAASNSVDSSSRGQVNPRARLGEMLVQEGVITQGQLDEALKIQQEQGGFLGNTLVSLRHIDQGTLMSFLVKQCKIPHISLLDYNVDDGLFNLVPRELCLKHLCIPIDKLGKILTVAMVNPFDADALESVRETCPDLKIKPILCDYNHFDQVARKHLKASDSDDDKDGDAVSAESFGLRPATPSKGTAKATPKKQSSPAKTPARGIASEQDRPPADVEALVARIEASFATGLDKALAPLLSTVESMQHAIESLGHAVPVASNVEAFPEAAVKAKPRKSADGDVLVAAGVVPQDDDRLRSALLESPLSNAYSFDSFFPGPANEVTESLVRSLAESSDAGHSPVYLTGGVGIGKTHLLQAIGNAYSATNPDVRVRAMTAGMFVREFDSESSSGGIHSFLETFSKADVFLLDDVQMFADREDVQAAFVEVFDALRDGGRTIAVTGLDRDDGSRTLNEQLRSRLSGSVVAMIKPPEFATRIEILRHLAEVSDIDLSDKILALIAERIKDDVRRLKGAFDKVEAHVRVVGGGVSVNDVRDMIVQFDAEAVA